MGKAFFKQVAIGKKNFIEETIPKKIVRNKGQS